MKKFFILAGIGLGLFSSAVVKAQATFAPYADTIWANVTTTANVSDVITNLTGGTLTLKWRVIASSFPADWLTDVALGICDNQHCYSNTAGVVWNGTTGTPYTATYPANTNHDSIGDFHLVLNLTGASTGSHFLTVNATEMIGLGSGYSKSFTFVINKVAAAVANVNNSENDVTLYPNPATSEINVLYSPSADVKNISIYSIIGKLMAVYKVTDNNSANLNLENVPSGVYFIRLFNSHGDVVVTRKITKL